VIGESRDAPLRGPAGAIAALAVAAVVATACFALLASWPLIDPDEGRNALIALEMARSGNFLVPTLGGLPFLDKPFLYFASGALSIRALGETALAARLPSALFALGVVAMVALFALRELGGRAARVTALACASMPLFLAFARIAILDACLAFFVVAAILAFQRAIEECDRERRNRFRSWNVAAWAAIAGGVLVKGPVALLVPLLVAVPYSIWRRRARAVWWLGGPLVLAAVVAPWLAAVEARVPGFLRYALVTETAARIATDELNRTEPFWYFVPLVAAAAFPWSWSAVAGFGAARRRTRESAAELRTMVFLALWFLLPLLLFSIFRSKRPQYLVPLLPALALWAGWLASGRDGRLAGRKSAAAAWIGVGVAAAALRLRPDLAGGSPALERFPAALPFAGSLAATAIAAGLAALVARRRVELAAWALAAPVLLMPWLARDLLAEVGESRSARGLVSALAPQMTPTTEVVGVARYPPSAAFYLDRQLVLSSVDGSELTSNSVLRFYSELVKPESGPLRDGDYWRRALARRERPRAFLVGPRDDDVAALLAGEGCRAVESGRHRAFLCPPRAAPAQARDGAEE